MDSKLFTPGKIGPIEIKNRIIRASAFEAMCPGHKPSQQLKDYHTAVAKGGVGMTSVAYAAVCQSGLSFESQLIMDPSNIPGFRDLTDSIHRYDTKACIQLGHCGNMSHKRVCGCLPVGASTGFNLYSPTFVHGLTESERIQIAKKHGDAVRIASEGGFDAVEIHAGHGYLISQFLAPYTNHRRDQYGGSFSYGMQFIDLCMYCVLEVASNKIDIMV